MKKIFFLAAVAMMSFSAMATELWSGNQHVSWGDGGLHLDAAKFADAKPGDKLVVTFTEASDGIEFKLMNETFDHLAGSREAAWIEGNGSYEQFLTVAGVAGLQTYGLEIIGANFNATKVELLEGKELREDVYTVWTGFFWANEWTTLELYRDAYKDVDFSNVEAIRFYCEAASGEYVLNFKENWEEGGSIADQSMMTDGEGYKELALTPELRTRVAEAGHWMIQFNKEALDPFNVTDVVLVMPLDPQGVQNTVEAVKAQKLVENGQLVILKNGVRYNAVGAAL